MSLELTDIHVTVPDGPDQRTILASVDLHVAAGELVAITGASGSGKSTLIGVGGLLRRPQRGRVAIAGNDVTDATDRQRTAVRRDHIGIVFQSPNLLPSLTALEQLELVAHLDGRITDTERRRARELLDTVGLDDRRMQRPAQLSGGERQRVALARALMRAPAVVLADEPTAALDEPRGREIMALLAELTRWQRTATVIITHAPHQLSQTDRTLHLADGRLTDPSREPAASIRGHSLKATGPSARGAGLERS